MSEHDIVEVKTAFEGLNTAFEAYKAADQEAKSDFLKKGDVDPLIEAKMATITSAMDGFQGKLNDFELAQKRKTRVVTDEMGREINMDAKAADWAKFVGGETRKADEAKEFSADQLGEYKAAFDKLVRGNFRSETLTEVERKALSVGSASDGGFFVDPDMSGRIVQQVYETSAVRAYSSVQVISTDTLEGFYDNDEVGFGWVEELEARPVTSSPAVGKWVIPVHEMYAMPKASQKLLDDANVSIESWLDAKIADKFARSENSAFVTGDGTGKPRGFMTYANGTDLTNSVEQFKTGVNGGFAAAPAGGDALLNALYGLKAPYRANATWFMNTSTMGAVRKLKDSNGDYLWSPSVAAGQPSTLFGYPVAAFEDMADIATGSLSIAVGDMGSAYQVVDRMGIRMLRDPYSSKPNVLFYATKRTGGDMINGEAIKAIDFSA